MTAGGGTQSSLRAEGEAIQGLQKKDWIASSAFGLLAMTVGPSASAQRRWGLWPPRNDGGTAGNPQPSLRAEGEAIQGLQKKDWIASSAFGLLAMTAGPLASAQ